MEIIRLRITTSNTFRDILAHIQIKNYKAKFSLILKAKIGCKGRAILELREQALYAVMSQMVWLLKKSWNSHH